MRLIDADLFVKEVMKHFTQPNYHPDADTFQALDAEIHNEYIHGFIEDIEDQPTVKLNDWIPCSERLPKACYKSGNSEEVLITLGWFYNNGEFREVDDEQYIGYFNEGLYNDYIECDEDERLEMEEILNDCWNVYEKGQHVTVDLTTNRKVIAWQSLPESYKVQ
jgi:hypothetical protein